MSGWQHITSAVGLALAGDTQRGRDALAECWQATTDTDHAQRCVIAHYLADLQSSIADEVSWDEAALSEHAHVTDEDLAPVGLTSPAGLAPSLHLNLGDGYLRQGRVEAARAQLKAGIQARSALPTDGYGALIRAGLDRLAKRVHELEPVNRDGHIRRLECVNPPLGAGLVTGARDAGPGESGGSRAPSSMKSPARKRRPLP